MHSQGTHIVTRCQWKTAFDSKPLAHQLQNDISSWSSYKMKRIINDVFDSICPDGQTLKIQKLAINLGTITYENMMTELPLRLEEALRNALYDLIMYPKNGDQTFEIINESIAQVHVLRSFLIKGMLPWNYQENYGTVSQIMLSQLTNNRLDLIQMIQEVGKVKNVRKRIAWQFSDAIIKKIIIGLEPNNHQQIISFSEEFVKVQEKETIIQTSTNDLKKNIWLWILNYLFTDRGTIFNKVAFVRNTIEQMANHFNLSYEIMVEMIESAIERANEYLHVNKGFIAILKLLSEELHDTAFTRIKTEKQQESFWLKVTHYFNTPTLRSTSVQKNEFNELVINLSKLDAARFQKIVLQVDQKPRVWKEILKDLIPAAIENLFVALAPSQSKEVLTQISFLSKLKTQNTIPISILDLYVFGVEFCVTHQHASVAKHAFLTFTIEKLAKQQQQSMLAILECFISAETTRIPKKTSFISLYTTLQSLYKSEVSNTKTFTSETALEKIITTYITEIQQKRTPSKKLEETIERWLSASPTTFWNIVRNVKTTPKVIVHLSALVALYGTTQFVKTVSPTVFGLVVKLQQILDVLISKHPKEATILRKIKNVLIDVAFEILWTYEKASSATFFIHLLRRLPQHEKLTSVSKNNLKKAIALLLQTPKIRTVSWTASEFVSIQKQYKIDTERSATEEILALIEQSEEHTIISDRISKLVRAKKTQVPEFKAQSERIVNYLVPQGHQIYKRLHAQFLQQTAATKNTLNPTQIKQILHDCFWQSIVLYDVHRGEKEKFVKLFEETITTVFPALKSSKNQKTVVTSKSTILQTQIVEKPVRLSVVALLEALTYHLEVTNSKIEISEQTYSYKELFALGLETSPKQLRTILKETVQSEKQLKFLQKTIGFEEFIVLISNDASYEQSAALRAIHILFVLAKQLGNSQMLASLQTIFWKQTIAMIQAKYTAKKILEMLLKTTFDTLSEIETLDQITIVKHIQNNSFTIPEILKTVLVDRHRIFELVTEEQYPHTLSETFEKYIQTQKIEVLSEYLITQYTIPTWFVHKEALDHRSIINELVRLQPLVVLKTIRSQQVSTIQLTKFSQTIRFSILISSLLKLYPTQHKQLSDIQRLYENIAFISMRGISSKNVQEILVRKVLVAWQTSNWSLITSETIWNELLWETCGKRTVQKRDFFTAIDTIKAKLPASLQLTYKMLLPLVKSTAGQQKMTQTKNIKKMSTHIESTKLPKEGIAIPNAGLVILNTYFLILLERLGAVQNDAFISDEAQQDAVHYLQYIVTGHTETEESLLTLNKILVGLSPDAPVKNSIDMTSEQKELIDGMIQAAINYWTAIGQTSINGFRGNWLVREGILSETEERWELTVEKKAYDILMLKSPFSFSIIKLPWMTKPLHVTWPF